MKIVQLVTISLITLVAGVFWGTWANLGGPMSLVIAATIISTVLVVVLYRRHAKAALVLAAAALGLLVVSTAITLSVNVPIDRQIAGWTLGSLPADWARIQHRWEFYHELRTALTLVGAGCLFASALWTRHGQRDLQRAARRTA